MAAEFVHSDCRGCVANQNPGVATPPVRPGRGALPRPPPAIMGIFIVRPTFMLLVLFTPDCQIKSVKFWIRNFIRGFPF